ncbi:MAG: serine protease [Nocardioides sp.]
MDEQNLFETDAFDVPTELAELESARAAAEDRFLDRANVVGVGVGHKITAGASTSKPSVMVLVSEKLPDSMLDSKDKISKTVESVPTDVLEVGHLFAGGGTLGSVEELSPELQAVDAQTLARRVRPVRPGYSVGHFKITAGTIGAGAYDIAPLPGKPPRYYILSNNHVLANSNDAALGDPVYQPGPYDGGTAADAIGRLARFVPIKFDGSCNYVDCAVAEVPFDTLDRDVYWSGYPTTAAAAAGSGCWSRRRAAPPTSPPAGSRRSTRP